ncbi:DUF429 domain-containing protein [Salinigranum salinum]|uniref:DUF429 domain-containing protein n=1 Tax=Salinigranum salinum TaxID=1364937 RepID=UPI0012609FCA|nr:DUF429 domain-containing protein [Salinigranum salinum]
MIVAGVDGCYEGWIAVQLDGTDVTTVTKKTFEDVWNACQACDRVLVDVPIGLVSATDRETDGYKRRCDTLARQRIASPSSVFQVPVREAVEAWIGATDDKREAARRAQQAATGKGLTSQTLSLLPKIAEVDEFVRSCDRTVADLSNRLFETHPELCFTALNRGGPLSNPKSTPHSDAGLFERYRLLDGSFEGDTATNLWKVLGEASEREVTFDDVLDAFVLALTARSDVATLPSSTDGEIQSDPETGWQIAMSYAPPGAFDVSGGKTKPST